MTTSLYADLTQRIQLLQPGNIQELLLFIDFLISKQQKLQHNAPNKRPGRLLADLERIPVPVNHVVILPTM